MSRERWLVRLLVDRDPELEAPPDQWQWAYLVLSVQLVGLVADEPTEGETCG